MLRRLAEQPGLVFGLVFAWKLALLVFTAQPIPANDAFFYDGPVVNHLLHGDYVNPALAQVLPISAEKVFSAYPPLYHLLLTGWMRVFGTSALAAMWLHVLLLGGGLLVWLAMFRRLSTPAWCVNLAGLYLVSITFHDRPDTLAHLMGALAIYGSVRAYVIDAASSPTQHHWYWFVAVWLLLAFGTSLQIGVIYLCWSILLLVGGTWLKRVPLPWLPAAALAIAMAGLIGLVRFKFPLLWTGFLEHAELTPSVTGWRLPGAGDLLKLVRTAPAILLVGGWFMLLAVRGGLARERLAQSATAMLALSGMVTATALMCVCLVFITANTAQNANYLQPVILGCFLAAMQHGLGGLKLSRGWIALFLAAAGLVSVRAIGMTTWGVACHADIGYHDAMQSVRRQLQETATDKTVVLSSAYLYEAARHPHVRWIHADWPGKPALSETTWEGEALMRLKPAKLIITQFDYYRRYEVVLRLLQSQPNLVEFKVNNAARLRPPDSFKSLQRVVQHVSWAPVVVEFAWR
ncbi:MAG: hypothetical protein KJ070_01565 [Verrucomicrobia bacterium]|nr:hypothetical protein [Verrucomicrobiota bacterium]